MLKVRNIHIDFNILQFIKSCSVVFGADSYFKLMKHNTNEYPLINKNRFSFLLIGEYSINFVDNTYINTELKEFTYETVYE
jgi:hypothetical protein